MELFFVEAERILADLGPWGAVLAFVIMTVTSILPIPAEAPAMVNGMLFGSVYGTAITFAGALAGALISFELARALGRPFTTRLVSDASLQRVDGVVARLGWRGLLVARLLPVVAFTALNWGSGLTAVPRARFVWTTALGILPGVILFTAFGSAMPTLLRRQPWVTAASSLLFFGAIAFVSVRARNQTLGSGPADVAADGADATQR